MNEPNRRTARAAILIIFVVFVGTVLAAAVGWLPGWAVAVVTPVAAVADTVLFIRYRRRPATAEPTETFTGWRPPEPKPVYAVPLRPGDVTVLVEALEWLDRVTPAPYPSASAGVLWARHLATKVRTNAGLARNLGHETTPLMPFDIHQADNALQELQRDQPVDEHTIRLGDLVKRLRELEAVAQVRDWTVDLLDKDPGGLRIRDTDKFHWSSGKIPPSINDLPAPGPEARGDLRS